MFIALLSVPAYREEKEDCVLVDPKELQTLQKKVKILFVLFAIKIFMFRNTALTNIIQNIVVVLVLLKIIL